MLKENYRYITQQQIGEYNIQTPNYPKMRNNYNLLTNCSQEHIQNKYYIQPYEFNINKYNNVSPDSRLQRKIEFNLDNNDNTFIHQNQISSDLTKNKEKIKEIDYNEQSYKFLRNSQSKKIPEDKFIEKIKQLPPQNYTNNRNYININNNPYAINPLIYNNYYININVSPHKSNTVISQQYVNNPFKKQKISSKLNSSNSSSSKYINVLTDNDLINESNNSNNIIIKNNTESNLTNISPLISNPSISKNKLNIIKLNNDENKIMNRCNSNDNIYNNNSAKKLKPNNNEEVELKRKTNRQILLRKPSKMKKKLNINDPNNKDIFKQNTNYDGLDYSEYNNKRGNSIKNFQPYYQNKAKLINIPSLQNNYNFKGGYEMMIKDFVPRFNTVENVNNRITEKNGLFLIEKEKELKTARKSQSKRKRNAKNTNILDKSPIIINNNYNKTNVNFYHDLRLRIDYLGKSHCGKINGVFKINQDYYMVNENINNIKNFNIFILCDGHGINGHLISNFVSQYLILQISTHPCIYSLYNLERIYYKLKENDYQIIKNIFLDTDNKIYEKQFDTSRSGTTCVFVIQLGNKLICGNIGDSRAILIYDVYNDNKLNYTQIFPMSIDAKPNLPTEKERITNNGGEVRIGKNCEGRDSGPFRVYAKGMNQPGLAMSRSLGDFICKKLGVSPEPTFKEYNLDESCKYLVLGSDGVWDYLDNEEIMRIGNKHYLNGNLDGFCEEVIGNAVYRWECEDFVTDDITLIVVFFKFH